jgi:hypothetical protein
MPVACEDRSSGKEGLGIPFFLFLFLFFFLLFSFTTFADMLAPIVRNIVP